jgi:uncharacterized protein
MKMQAERFEGSNAIARHSAEGVIVNGIAYTRSVLVPWTGQVVDWSATDFETLSADDFAAIATGLRPELVIFGTGRRIRFPSPALTRVLTAQGIGIETMDTAAACRTYNVLVAEGRSAVAALLFEA